MTYKMWKACEITCTVEPVIVERRTDRTVWVATSRGTVRNQRHGFSASYHSDEMEALRVARAHAARKVKAAQAELDRALAASRRLYDEIEAKAGK